MPRTVRIPDWELDPPAERLARMIDAAELPEPEREFRFHQARRWRIDFAWPALLLAVEYEGATWSTGRHVYGSGYRKDCDKYNELAIQGWTLIRITADMLRDGSAIEVIQRAIAARQQAAQQ